MSATASDKPLSGADDQDLGIVSAQESSTAANVVLKRPAANQLSSNAASGSSPRHAAASVGSSCSSHLKHARTVTNHTSRRQSVRDAPVTSESSSSSCSPAGRSSSVVPLLADSANEVRHGSLTPHLSASYTCWHQTLEHGWVYAQVPHTMAWASGALANPPQRWPPVLRDNRFLDIAGSTYVTIATHMFLGLGRLKHLMAHI